MNVIAIPTDRTFTELNDVKFSLLILHKSAKAIFVEFIRHSDLSLDKNLLSNFIAKLGSCIFLLADNTTTINQKPNVGIATSMTKIPIKEPPLSMATVPAINAKMLPTKTSAIISAVATHAAFPAVTPFLMSHAILTISPPINDGVVCVTNSPAILAFMVFRVVL